MVGEQVLWLNIDGLHKLRLLEDVGDMFIQLGNHRS